MVHPVCDCPPCVWFTGIVWFTGVDHIQSTYIHHMFVKDTYHVTQVTLQNTKHYSFFDHLSWVVPEPHVQSVKDTSH